MPLQSNPELELAYEYVCYTNKSIFLTGKAGTGKTTFLHKIKKEAPKRMAIVAPTGVAAINAKGMTIHSFFQLPFGPYLPGNAREAARQRRFSGEKIRLIRSLDLLVIDEVSMVRADLLDGIDDVLRRYKDPSKPFGGVQLLMIGDLHQLPPVVKDEEWYLLRDHYRTPYFFGSLALQEAQPIVVELKHIFRQSDDTFIRLLNKVRNNDMDAGVLATLNSRFDPNFQAREEDGYITLTTHNASANEINAQKLAGISQKVHTFQAEITGDFPAHAYPADEVLELKTGAQVMFVKNDTEREKRYYNGKIGQVTRIEKDEAYVLCPGEAEPIVVARAEWANVKYSLNEHTKEVEEEMVGSFTQFPLRLAWAITIHKSQGLTFERVILDAQAAFAHGQVYVALSRCKSFEGIVLISKITPSSVRTDGRVKSFSEEAEKNAPGPAQLEQDKTAYQQSLILELFSFKALKRAFNQMNRVLLEHENKMLPGALQQFKTLASRAEEQVFPVGETFRRQLRGLFAQGGLPEKNEEIQGRIQKAGAWFAEKVKSELQPAAQGIEVITDNQKIRKTALETLEKLQREIFTKIACFTAIQSRFTTQAYLRTRAHADLDFQAARQKAPTAAPKKVGPQDTAHPELYARLEQWRKEAADEQDVALYMVLPTRSLLDLAEKLPLNNAQLKKIHGIGKGRANQYGAELISLIESYCAENDISTASLLMPEEEEKPAKPPKADTKKLSFELFQSGKTVQEIAGERGLVASTIEGHLAHFISQGELSAADVIPEETAGKIRQFLTEHPGVTTLSEVRTHFDNAYSYGEIKMVMAEMQKAKMESAKPEGGSGK
ncbi:MAG: helix-turn-helix domain-containing protein [Lewinellaceae bacterium]|nr:helix-turn-helix domain-containing protein [Phaeodactylibacter sp.]MCB9350137.1 helix-turn-helix domain-containing protein [Lewinellaceae bacterium]